MARISGNARIEDASDTSRVVLVILVVKLVYDKHNEVQGSCSV